MRCLFKIILALLAAWALAFLPARASAIGPVRLYNWDGTLEFGYTNARDKLTLPVKAPTEFSSTGYDERVTLRSNWYVLDPKLFYFSMGAGLTFNQNSAGSRGAETSSSGGFTNYDFSGTLLGAKPYATNFFASRNRGTSSTGLGGLTETTGTREGVSFNWRNSFLPLNLMYQRSNREDSTIFAGAETARGEITNNFSARGSKPFYNADLDYDYELGDVADKFFPQASHTDHRMGTRYSFDFGKDYNKTSNTSFGLDFRQGVVSSLTTTASESLNIIHTQNLTSSYNYSFAMRQRGEESASGDHRGSMNLSHNLYNSLFTGLGLSGSFSDVPGGSFANLGGNLNFSYRRKIFKGLGLMLGTALNYSMVDQNLPEGVIHAVGEGHTLSGLTPERLEKPLVILPTIVVTNSSGAMIFIRDVDYEVRLFGDFVEIARIITGAIGDGERVLVDYDYRVSPDVSYSTLATNYNIGLALPIPWLTVSYSHTKSTQTRLSGPEGQVFLEGTTSDTVSADVNLSGNRYQLSLGNGFSKLKSIRLNSRSWRFNQVLLYRPFDSVSVSLGTAESFDKFEEMGRETSNYSQRLALFWQPLSFVLVDFFGSSILRKDNVSPSETVFNFGVAPAIMLAKLTINIRGELIRREVASTRADGIRLSVNVVRKF